MRPPDPAPTLGAVRCGLDLQRRPPGRDASQARDTGSTTGVPTLSQCQGRRRDNDAGAKRTNGYANVRDRAESPRATGHGPRATAILAKGKRVRSARAVSYGAAKGAPKAAMGGSPESGNGARGRTRTGMALRPADFKSDASTDFATRAWVATAAIAYDTAPLVWKVAAVAAGRHQARMRNSAPSIGPAGARRPLAFGRARTCGS